MIGAGKVVVLLAAAIDDEGGDVPGQEGAVTATDRVMRSSGATTIIRRAAFIIAFLTLGAL